MNKLLVGIFTVALCFTMGYSLQCYKCELGFWNLCATTVATCAGSQQCYSAQGTTLGFIKFGMSGCLDVIECNVTSNVVFPAGSTSNSSIYQVTKTCCTSDLCNTAAPLANTHTLTLAIASLVSLLLTKSLV